MLLQTILLKFKTSVFNTDKQAIMARILKLKDKIPDISRAFVGKDMTDLKLNHGYSHAVFLEFANENALVNYSKHPAQHELDDILKNSLDDLLVITTEKAA